MSEAKSVSKARTWSVREADRDDDAALAELFRAVFGFERSAAHYQWKFSDNPDGRPVIAVAVDGDRIVGQYALWPTTLRLGTSTVMGAQSLDTMTHPDYRGQGMFTVLAEQAMAFAAARGIEVLYGFPNESSYPGFLRKLDWDCTGQVPLYIRPLKPSRHHRVPAWVGPFADVVSALLPRGSDRGLRIVEGRPSDADLDILLSAWAAEKGLVRIARSVERAAWRFADASEMNYRFVTAHDEQGPVALAVWGTELRHGNAVLAELLGQRPEALGAVVSAAVVQARRAACPLFMAASSMAKAVPALRRAGFIRKGSVPQIVRKLTTRTLPVNVHTHDAWVVFGADFDMF